MMKKYFLMMLLGALTLTASCSSDEVAPTAQADVALKKAPDVKEKKIGACVEMGKLKLNCNSLSVNAPVTFSWNNTDLTYTFNRTYQSYIQIESNSSQSLSIPVHAFSESMHTVTKAQNGNSFRYRLVILGYDKGELACEAISPWQVFDYNKTEQPAEGIAAL